jgi:hypothetical protein
MTWIRTVPLAEADDRLRQVIAAQRALYPPEYATPIHPAAGGGHFRNCRLAQLDS